MVLITWCNSVSLLQVEGDIQALLTVLNIGVVIGCSDNVLLEKAV